MGAPLNDEPLGSNIGWRENCVGNHVSWTQDIEGLLVCTWISFFFRYIPALPVGVLVCVQDCTCVPMCPRLYLCVCVQGCTCVPMCPRLYLCICFQGCTWISTGVYISLYLNTYWVYISRLLYLNIYWCETGVCLVAKPYWWPKPYWCETGVCLVAKPYWWPKLFWCETGVCLVAKPYWWPKP